MSINVSSTLKTFLVIPKFFFIIGLFAGTGIFVSWLINSYLFENVIDYYNSAGSYKVGCWTTFNNPVVNALFYSTTAFYSVSESRTIFDRLLLLEAGVIQDPKEIAPAILFNCYRYEGIYRQNLSYSLVVLMAFLVFSTFLFVF